MRKTADVLFSKTVFNRSSSMLPFVILRYVCLPKLSSVLCKIPKANLHLGKLSSQLWHFVSSVAQKRNPPNFNKFSCIYKNLPNTCPKQFRISGDTKWDFYKLSSRKQWCLTFSVCKCYDLLSIYCHFAHSKCFSSVIIRKWNYVLIYEIHIVHTNTMCVYFVENWCIIHVSRFDLKMSYTIQTESISERKK